MNHNPLKLIEGETVVLDKGYANSSRVVIVSLSELQMYTRVISIEDALRRNPDIKNDSWEVMTNRLSRPLSDEDVNEAFEKYRDKNLRNLQRGLYRK